MMILEKFKAEHFKELEGEPSVAYLRPHLTTTHLEALEKLPFSYTGIKNGKVLFCGGVSEYWPNRGEAWVILSERLEPYDFIFITKMARKFLAACPVRRIEASVVVDFEEGHRWANMLGFKMEAPCLEAYLPDGKNCALYSKVRAA